MTIGQLIPSQYCLECRGCCVFTREKSEWCAHLAAEEEIALEKREPGVSFGGRLLTVPVDGKHYCRFLNVADHHCRVYASRPLECALYPFLLSSENGRLKLYAHLACPFVREESGSVQWEHYLAVLKSYLLAPENIGILQAAVTAYPDYSMFKAETQFIADIDFKDMPAALLAQRPDMDQWFGLRPARLSARSFVSMFAWAGNFDFSISETDGNRLIMARQHGCEFLYCPPLGEAISARAVEQAFKLMKGGAARIEAVSADELVFFDDRMYRCQLQGEEYYYDRVAISELKGKGYRSKRSDVNSFFRKYRPVFRPFRPADQQACHDIFDRWLDMRRSSYEDDIYRAMLVENRAVHRRLIDNALALGLIGRVVEVGGVLVGYTFGYPLNDEAFCVALEVTDPAFKGLASYIFHEFCGDSEIKRFRYINAMDDFGMPSVARAKRSWRPVFLEKVYAICLKP